MTQIEIIETIATLNNENQIRVYNELMANGLTSEDIQTIKSMVFFHKLFNDNYLYNAVVENMGGEIYKEFNR